MQAVLSAVPVTRIELKRPTLEDVFVGIAGGDGRTLERERAA
jgi:hypothetical protein